jgi:hypothetical protein
MHVLGILFGLGVGKEIDEAQYLLSFPTGKGNPIFVCDALTKQIRDILGENVREARKTRSFLRAKAKHDKSLSSKATKK